MYLVFVAQAVSDRMALVPRSVDVDIELADSRLPPTWSDGLEEAQYALSRIRGKLKQLSALHSRHLQRPTLDDTRNEEIQIEALSQEIMRVNCSAIVTCDGLLQILLIYF